jgi:hypothetical protein
MPNQNAAAYDKALAACRLMAWLDDEASGDFATIDGVRPYLSSIGAKAREAIKAHEASLERLVGVGLPFTCPEAGPDHGPFIGALRIDRI